MAMSLFCTIASANISDENVNSARERLLRSKPNPTYTLDKQGHDHRKLMCAPDTTAPSVSTGIENQFLCGVGGAGVGLQDLHFTFTAEDNCDPDKLEISIKLWSNEVTAKEPDVCDVVCNSLIIEFCHSNLTSNTSFDFLPFDINADV